VPYQPQSESSHSRHTGTPDNGELRFVRGHTQNIVTSPGQAPPSLLKLNLALQPVASGPHDLIQSYFGCVSWLTQRKPTPLLLWISFGCRCSFEFPSRLSPLETCSLNEISAIYISASFYQHLDYTVMAFFYSNLQRAFLEKKPTNGVEVN